MTKTRSTYLALLAVLLSPMASADVITFSGDWISEGTDNSALPGPYGGSFSFSFDDSVVTGSGFEVFNNLPLLTLSWSGDNYGSFDVLNSGGALSFIDGTLFELFVGGNASAPGGISSIGADDFLVNYDGSGGLVGALYTSIDVDATVTGQPGSGSYTTAAVPEPGTLALLGIGLFGMGLARRKKI